MVDVKKFNSGFKTIFVPDKCILLSGFFLCVRVGSRFEDEENNGITHYLEHIVFKNKWNDKQSISDKLKELGAIYNAMTSREYTIYYFWISPSEYDTGLEIMHKIFTEETFSDSDMLKEKGVVLSEMKMRGDQIFNKIYSNLIKLIYPKNHSLQNEIIGTPNTINSLDRYKIHMFKKKFYKPSNTSLIVIGTYKTNEIIKKINSLPSFTRNFNQTIDIPKLPKLNSKIFSYKQLKGISLDYFLMVFHSYGTINTRENIILKLLSILIRNKLMDNIREKYGLTYGFNVVQDDLSDHGLFMIASYTASQFILPMIGLTIQTIQEMKKVIQDSEINSAKTQIKNRFYMPSGQGSGLFYCEQALYSKKICDIRGYLNIVSSISKSDITKMLKHVFTYSNMVFSAVGALDKKHQLVLVKYLKLIK